MCQGLRLWLALILISACSAARAASVLVTTELTGPAVIEVGQTTSLVVKALVQNPTGPNDGIFTFDLDLIIANILAAQPPTVAVDSLVRPGVNDALFGGSDGTADPSGLLAIHGGYLSTDVGIGMPATVLTVQLRGIAVGTSTITPGPSIVPYGVDFLLYESPSVQVSYARGVSIDVRPGSGGGDPTVVPLPTSAWAGLALLPLCFFRKRLPW